jgi:large subunit ribosomal protein L32e
MAEIKKLLETRKTIKSKKPEFIQQDYHKKRRLSRKWKRPTGLQSKMRHQFKGYSRRVKQGWRSPVEIRGYHPSGLEPVLIHTIDQLAQLKSHQAIIIASNVGMRKKILILDKALAMNIKILNIKPESFKAKAEAKKKAHKEEAKKKEEKKKKTLEDSVKKSERKAQKKAEQESKETAESAEAVSEEKKVQEKKEKDEVLIHKQ